MTADGPEVFTGNEAMLKGALETPGGVHLLGGYPGSPVAGFFDALSTVKDLLNEKGIRAIQNNNEALAAAMLNGTQTLPCRAMIAMKSVGVHVAADALALGNMAGVHRDGGAIVVYGDDPWSDSTQVAADSRYISKHLYIPVVEPATPQEVKDFVPASFDLSRSADLFVGYLLTTNLADGGGTVQCRPNDYPVLNTRHKVELETRLINLDKRVLLPPRTWWQEEAFTPRFVRACQAASRLGMNQILYPAQKKKPIGFVTSGMAHGYLLQALFEMGLLGEFPILKYGLTYPVDPEMIRRLGMQCQRIVVVEERRGFMEEQIADIVLKDRQRGKNGLELWGKQFPNNLRGIPDTRGLHPSILISRLAPLLKAVAGASVSVPAGLESVDRELETIETTGQADAHLGTVPARTPTFCPGCPHRDSADVCLEIQKRLKDADYMRMAHNRKPVDLIFHGDTGCYTMLMFPPTASLMHDYSGMGLGAGTGSGINPFVTNKSVVFMGDSTFFHSGQLAISQAVKLGQDITFIILDNSTTAMTGHQPTPGVGYDIIGNPTATQDIEDVVASLAGNSTLSVIRTNPEQRSQYLRLMEQTFLADGVKVIIADKECGITRMRRKRRQERAVVKETGFLPSWDHMNVNLDVCRFCLTCAEMTACPGLKHTQTDYGPKMDTDITWCVNDGACERVAPCAAFERVTIKRKRPPRSRLPELGLDDIPEPTKRQHDDVWRCCLAGVGGMGIGLATSILVRAGHKEGYEVLFLDKKGLAIRNGGIISQVVYNVSHNPITAVIPYGKADLLLGIDVLEAARALDPAARTRIASKDRTAAVVNTDKISTIRGLMGQEDFDPAQLERLIRDHTDSDDFMARDISRICEKYLGSKLYANIMMLGFAFQTGLIPVSMHSMAWAIKDTIRADFRKNLYAFNMGRKLVVQPDLFQGPPHRDHWRDLLDDKCRSTIRRFGRRGEVLADALRTLSADTVESLATIDEPLKRDVVVRIYDTMRWGGMDYARRYASAVRAVYEKEAACGMAPDAAATRAVVHNLAAAMLIKDAVFVAELSTSPEKYAHDREKYNVNTANGDRIVYHPLWHLTLGQRKLTLHPRHWMLKMLRGAKSLRKWPSWQKQAAAARSRYLELVDNFNPSTKQAYQQQLARLSGASCMDCNLPACQQRGCPLESPAPRWIDLAQGGQWRKAAELLLSHNNFPEFTAAICPAPCQKSCKHGLDGYPVQVRDIERQIIEKAFAKGYVTPKAPGFQSGMKVAIIGSGPAGLAAAQQLARAGHRVTVFDQDAAPGGLLRYGIPAQRLSKDVLDRRIEQLKAEGISFRNGVTIGRDIIGMTLRHQFDSILIATGAARPRDLNVPGRQNKNIAFALEFLRQAANGKGSDWKGKTVAIIGGGETGNDCVEAAIRCGAREVHQFEILAPANGQSAHSELTEGDAKLHRRWAVATRGFEGNGQLTGLRAVDVTWQSTSTGPRACEVADSEFAVKADLAVLALGFEAIIDCQLAEQLGLQRDDRGKPVVTDFASSIDGIFVAGDLNTGAATVARAIHTGRQAAKRIDAYLASRKQAAAAKPQPQETPVGE